MWEVIKQYPSLPCTTIERGEYFREAYPKGILQVQFSVTWDASTEELINIVLVDARKSLMEAMTNDTTDTTGICNVIRNMKRID